MADVNEEIVGQYLKVVKKWLYAADIGFEVDRGHSNIDLLAYDPCRRRFWDVEVKYRSAFVAPERDSAGRDASGKSMATIAKQFVAYPERDTTLMSFTNGRKPRKLLVTTKQMMGKGARKRVAMEKAFRTYLAKRGHPNALIWYFDDIVPELVTRVATYGRHNTELLQTIRMLKTYSGLGKDEPSRA